MNSLLGWSALSAVGLAGIVLYTQHSARVKDTHDMQQAELRCHYARYYAEMDSRWRDSPAKIQKATSDAAAACDEFHKKRPPPRLARSRATSRPTTNK